MLSAIRFKKSKKNKQRYAGNVFIAVDALLSGFDGSFTRFGYIEVLYVTECVGLFLIYLGFKKSFSGRK